MDIAMPLFAKTASRSTTTRPPVAAKPFALTRSANPTPRGFAGLFRREEPTTFHRCLAVHMYFAKNPSALE